MFNIQRFANEHPAGLFTPGKPVQNFMVKFRPKSNKNTIVRGLIPLPLPKNANLGNSSKKINYKKVNVNGNIRLSNLVRNRPGVYIGMYDRNANVLNLEKGRGNKQPTKNKMYNFFRMFNGLNNYKMTNIEKAALKKSYNNEQAAILESCRNSNSN